MGQESGKLKVIAEAAGTSSELIDIPASDDERERALFARADKLRNAAVSRKDSPVYRASLANCPFGYLTTVQWTTSRQGVTLRRP